MEAGRPADRWHAGCLAVSTPGPVWFRARNEAPRSLNDSRGDLLEAIAPRTLFSTAAVKRSTLEQANLIPSRGVGLLVGLSERFRLLTSRGPTKGRHEE